MLVSEIFTRVSRQFGDTAGVEIDINDITRWINDAQRDIVVQNDLLQAVGTANSVANQREYTLPADLLTLRSIRYNGIKLRALTLSEVENLIPAADQVGNQPVDIPTVFWVWANKYELYPTPSDVQTMQIYYTRQPAAVVNPGDTPELPVQYHNRLVEYCLQQAYELDENWQAADTKKKQFDSGVNVLKDNVSWVERDAYPFVTTTSDWSEGSGR